ncbi:ARM repeat-containing protein [Pseudovirgaria hyperparasitica]|uniref:ARM repeat-containing protein n=1 Tax=Pseudovirgaria hyperparasitica TaxID=470096 RepID=A0A6A6WHF6_9PEZI|nr:ARM repeat-containing protein [Pseudovirgaria hyperparasitica]KAF2761659.1 ARM repeat-containing protein [Pseudovirgaria hyperparasitica]
MSPEYASGPAAVDEASREQQSSSTPSATSQGQPSPVTTNMDSALSEPDLGHMTPSASESANLLAKPTVTLPEHAPTTSSPHVYGAQARANELVHHSTVLAKEGRFQDAAHALREAAHLVPGDESVAAGWKSLGKEEQKNPLIGLCRTWVHSKSETDGGKVLDAVRTSVPSMNEQFVRQVLDIMMDLEPDDDVADQVTGELMKHPGARKWLAEKVLKSPTPTFNTFFDRGDDSADAIVITCLDDKAWLDEKSQIAAQRDVFQLSLAAMMRAGLDHPERAMRVIARSLAAEAPHLTGIIDADSFDVILSSLDIRLSNMLRGQATLATAKLIELSPDTSQKLITQFVTGRVKKPNPDALVVAFSAAAAIFPIVPSVAATLFLTEGFMSSFVNLVQERRSQTLDRAALELLSAACVEKTCREAISKHCRQWIQGIAEAAMDAKKSTLASLILMKIQDELVAQVPTSPVEEIDQPKPQDELVARFKRIVLGSDNHMKQDSVEGLAYASLQSNIKEQLAKDPVFLRRLIETMFDSTNVKPIMFGGLTIFVNITAYLPRRSEEEKRMADIRTYAAAGAAAKKPTKDDPLDDDDHVSRRCKQVLQSNIVPLLVACSKRASPAVRSQMLQILLALSKEQKHRPTMAQQGAVRLLLQVWDELHKDTHPMPVSYSPASNHACAHTLARILISINPAHIFLAGIPPSNAVRPLLSLLDEDAAGEGTKDLLPTFEALLALTNLASMDDTTPRDTILRLAWTTLETSLLLHNNTMVRRAAVELLCNLMPSPVCAGKFSDGSPAASQRLHVLLALADVEDVATRRAAGGALAMATEWEGTVSGILAREKGVNVLLDLCGDEDEGVRHRASVCVGHIVSAPGELGERGKGAVRDNGGVEVLKGVVKRTRDAGIVQVAAEALKQLL